jgi:hypothetical protein
MLCPGGYTNPLSWVHTEPILFSGFILGIKALRLYASRFSGFIFEQFGRLGLAVITFDRLEVI